jgi:hypothetical protein
MMKLAKFLGILFIGLVSTSAHAAFVYWEPTDGDVNFTYTTASGYSLGIFDVGDFDASQNNPLMLNMSASADTILIVADGLNFNATSSVTSSSITLFDDNQFVIALREDISNDWFEPISWFEISPNSNIYDITFSNGSVISIDATPTVIPVPAAVWLFGSGLIGLAGFIRRRRKR